MRYTDGFTVGNEDPNSGVICANRFGFRGFDNPAARGYACQLNIGATTYHNIQAGVKLWDSLKIRVGIDNVNDKQPPILYQNNSLNGNTDERTFDTVGRYYWTSLTYTF